MPIRTTENPKAKREKLRHITDFFDLEGNLVQLGFRKGFAQAPANFQDSNCEAFEVRESSALANWSKDPAFYVNLWTGLSVRSNRKCAGLRDQPFRR